MDGIPGPGCHESSSYSKKQNGLRYLLYMVIKAEMDQPALAATIEVELLMESSGLAANRHCGGQNYHNIQNV